MDASASISLRCPAGRATLYLLAVCQPQPANSKGDFVSLLPRIGSAPAQRFTVAIHEPLWRAGQTLKDAAFFPLPLPDNRYASWREFRIFVDAFRRGDHLNAGLTGIFSPKFQLKSNITGQQFLAFAQSHAEADVCFINVFPTLPYYSYNVWMQGESAHPGLLQRAQALLSATGIDWNLSATPRHNHSNLCYGNFWVGTPAFWEAYVGGVLDPIAHFLEANPDVPESKAVFDAAPHTVEAPFLPFITERLFSTYLSLHPELRVVPFPEVGRDPLLHCTTEFRREVVCHMRSRVDQADASNSFTLELIQEQALLSRLAALYHSVHFQLHRHPHLVPEEVPLARSGRVLS